MYLDQSAITTSTNRILSARSIYYRRQPRVKPIDLDLNEECDEITGKLCFSFYLDLSIKKNLFSTKIEYIVK